jgi:predicted dehydrogenase
VSYRAGLVGCGRIGCGFDDDPRRLTVGTHAGAYARVPGIELVAMADVDPAKLARYGDKFGVPGRYADHRAMLARERLDALSICTWSDSRRAILEDALAANVRAVFCEKPLAGDLAAGAAMIRRCAERGVVLMVNHRRRFDAYHRELGAYIRGGGLGRVQHVTCYYVSGIANSGTHLFDMLRLYCGEVSWVRARPAAIVSPNPDDPNLDGWLGLESGGLVTINACDVKAHYIFEATIVGTDGRLRISSTSVEELGYEVALDARASSEYRELRPAPAPVDPDRPHEHMIDAITHLVDCLDHGKTPYCTGEDGLKALEIICALRESADRDGAHVELPLKGSAIRLPSR